MTKVSKSLQRKWIHALESGKYKQEQYTLKNKSDSGDSFCCLGVLCDVKDKTKWNGPVWEDKTINLPTSLRWEVGLESFELTSDDCQLMVMNDRDKSDFIDIASTLRMLFNIWD